MYGELALVFERILGNHQRAGGRRAPIIEASEEEAQRGPVGEQRQGGALRGDQWAAALISVDERARGGDVEAPVPARSTRRSAPRLCRRRGRPRLRSRSRWFPRSVPSRRRHCPENSRRERRPVAVRPANARRCGRRRPRWWRRGQASGVPRRAPGAPPSAPSLPGQGRSPCALRTPGPPDEARPSPSPASRHCATLGLRADNPGRKAIRAAGLPRTLFRIDPPRSAIGAALG